MNKGIKEIMMAMGKDDGGTEVKSASLPKKKKVYVDEDVYNRLMQNGEATDADSDVDQEPDVPTMEKTSIAKTNPENEKPDISEEEEMPEDIEFDDDEDDSMIKKMGRLFGNDLSKIMKRKVRGE